MLEVCLLRFVSHKHTSPPLFCLYFTSKGHFVHLMHRVVCVFSPHRCISAFLDAELVDRRCYWHTVSVIRGERWCLKPAPDGFYFLLLLLLLLETTLLIPHLLQQLNRHKQRETMIEWPIKLKTKWKYRCNCTGYQQDRSCTVWHIVYVKICIVCINMNNRTYTWSKNWQALSYSLKESSTKSAAKYRTLLCLILEKELCICDLFSFVNISRIRKPLGRK